MNEKDECCGDCLLYKTPRCLYAHVSELILEGDVACCDFYQLLKRLEVFQKRIHAKKAFEKAVENL